MTGGRRPDLRLIVITDAVLAAPRELFDVVRVALEAGAPAIQLRDKTATSRRLLESAIELGRITAEYNALLFINDRLDVALAAGSDGVHLGPEDVPIDAARNAAGPELLIGYSTDRADQAREAENAGADYIGCGAVFGTSTKEVGDEVIGTEGLREVVDAVDIPVVGIGGVSPANVADAAAVGAAGVASVSAVMTADDPAAAVRALLRPFRA